MAGGGPGRTGGLIESRRGGACAGVGGFTIERALSGFAGGLDLSDPPPQSIGATLPSAGASSSSSS